MAAQKNRFELRSGLGLIIAVVQRQLRLEAQ
jgi:hypothetical protein